MKLADFQCRAYFRGPERKRCISRIASDFVTAEVKLWLHSNDRATCDVARDAFLDGRYTDCQKIAWEQTGEALRLSVTGCAGYVTSPRIARREALDSQISWLEESETNMEYIRTQSGRNFQSAVAAARWVLDCDGEYSGLDIHDEITCGKGTRLLVGHSFGCLHEEISEAFPEMRPLIPWHLSDMQAGTPDQMQALAEHTATLSQNERYQFNYAQREAYLDSLGLLESQSDEVVLVKGEGMRPAKGYRYGSGWVASKIPDDVLALINKLAVDAEKKAA